MKKKLDIRFVLYQVYNIHKVIIDCIKNAYYEDAYLLLNIELEKYQYIRDNLENNIKISSYYLEYSTTIETKINDIKYALRYIQNKIQFIPSKISKSFLLELYKLQLNNIIFYFNPSSKISYSDRKTIYYIFIYLCKTIKSLDCSFHLNNSEVTFFFKFRSRL